MRPGRVGIPPTHLRSLGMFFQLIRIRLGRVGERPYVPEQSQDGQNCELPFRCICRCAVVYPATAVLATVGRPGFARDPNVIPWLFLGLALVSLADIGVTVFVQTSRKLMLERARYDPINRAYLIMATGAVLSEAHAIYGQVLTLLSGSIFYGIGLTFVTWASLWWVRKRFKQSLESVPNG